MKITPLEFIAPIRASIVGLPLETLETRASSGLIPEIKISARVIPQHGFEKTRELDTTEVGLPPP